MTNKARDKSQLVELENMNLKGDITMKEYQHLIGKIIIATAIIIEGTVGKLNYLKNNKPSMIK